MGHGVAPHQSRRIVLRGWTRISALVFACAFLLALLGGVGQPCLGSMASGRSTAVGFENRIELGSPSARSGRVGTKSRALVSGGHRDEAARQVIAPAHAPHREHGTTIPRPVRFDNGSGKRSPCTSATASPGCASRASVKAAAGTGERASRSATPRSSSRTQGRDRPGAEHCLRHGLGPAQEPPTHSGRL